MSIPLPLASDKKLAITYRLEPGCLGPTGVDHIEKFCVFAEKGVSDVDEDVVSWNIVPRYDKTLVEMHYAINGKELCCDKAEKYLNVFQKNLEGVESNLQDRLTALIEKYWNR